MHACALQTLKPTVGVYIETIISALTSVSINTPTPQFLQCTRWAVNIHRIRLEYLKQIVVP